MPTEEDPRLTVLIIDSKPVFGGGQRMIKELCYALPGYRVIVIRPTDAPEEQIAPGASAVCRIAFPAWPMLLSHPKNMARVMPEVAQTADRLGRLILTWRPALIIVNDLYAAIPLVSLRMVGLRPRWCFWAHSCDYPISPLVNRLMASCGMVIGVSDAVSRHWRAHSTLPIRTIRNSVTLPEGCIQPVQLPDIPNHAWVVACCGRLDSNKNIDGLLLAWAQARSLLEQQGPAHLIIAGQGPDEDALRHLAHNLGLTGVVHFVGWRNDVIAVMQRSDAIVMPSLNEGLGLSLIEGQLLGKAVLGTPVGGIPEIITDGATGILARSPEASALADGLVRLRNQGSELAPAGRESAKMRFGVTRFRQKMAELVACLITEGQPPPPGLIDYSDFVERIRNSGQVRPQSVNLPLISVITIVRNGRDQLVQCRASILAQTWPAVEHIIIDGGSTDGTREWLEKQDSRIGPWVSEPDLGISDAFNKGIALARGEFIALLNADDEWMPETAALSIHALTDDPDAGWSFGGCAFTIAGKTVLHRAGDPAYARTIDRWMPVINHPTVVVKRSVYASCGLFRPELRLAMDYDFILRIHRAGIRGICLPHTLARMSLGGVTNGDGVSRAQQEASAIAIRFGRPILLAHLERLALNIQPWLRQAAIRCGLQRPWRRLKKIGHKG